MRGSFNRRQFLWGSAASAALATIGTSYADQPAQLEPWREGTLEIHHISTGRGNSVLVVCPDGTSLMFDAGAVVGTLEAEGPAQPNESRRPGEWIARYAQQRLRATPRQELDYFVLSHLHGDHMGDVVPSSPASHTGDYKLTGVTDVAELLPIRHLIDRDYPDYSYPAPTTYGSALNYIAFARSMAKHGTKVERLKVGSSAQIALWHQAAKYPTFAVRNLAANGEVWTGHSEETRKLFPDISTLKPGEMPTENACSIALRIDFGAFRYYIGGDLTCDTRFGAQPWMDVESAVARVAGPVSVAALDHHGYYDGTGTEFVRAMRARVYVLQSWHASHPALSVLDELYSPVLQTGDRDVFSTGIVHAAAVADARLSDRMRSQHGHVVVRVAPGGKQYEVLVLDDTQENGAVVSRWGPYLS